MVLWESPSASVNCLKIYSSVCEKEDSEIKKISIVVIILIELEESSCEILLDEI
jgi:hypothetical protein